MDIRKVKKLIELLEESGIAELEITEGEEGVRISRYPSSLPAAPAAAPQAIVAATPAAEARAPVIEEKTSPDGHSVMAPMVGTFYSSPAPGAKPFVEIGSQVEIGDVLCIIEAMKMKNQIEADRAGKVVSVLVENAEPVEYHQPLFIIE